MLGAEITDELLAQVGQLTAIVTESFKVELVILLFLCIKILFSVEFYLANFKHYMRSLRFTG